MNSIRAQNAILELLRSSLNEEREDASLQETNNLKGGADAMDALKDAFLAGGDAAEADDDIPSDDDHLVEEELDGDGEALSSNESSQNDNESQEEEEEIKEKKKMPTSDTFDGLSPEDVAYGSATQKTKPMHLNGGDDNLEFDDDEPQLHGGYVDPKRLIVITASTKFPFVMKQKQKRN